MSRHERAGAGRAAGWVSSTLVACWFGSISAAARAAPPDSIDAAASAPEAEPTTAADWYARGIELGSAGEFRAAAEAFLRSYAVTPTPEALFNAGLAYQSAGDPIAAITTYREFLAEPTSDPSLGARADQAIVELLREVGTLKGIRYSPNQPPAELYVDERAIELDDLPLLLTPGPVRIEVVDQAGVRSGETYEIAAGEALVVDLRALLREDPIEPEPNVVVPIVEVEPVDAQLRQRRAGQLRIATWVGLGLTGGAGVSLITLSSLAARERNAYLDATCLEFEGGDCPAGFTPDDPDRHLRAYQRYQTGAIISGALVGGFALGSLVVGLVSLRLERKPARQQAVRLRPALGGLTLEF